jgi:hypothetical protein
MAKKKETVFKEKVLKRLRAIPHTWVCKVQQVSKVGTPDILICLAGAFIVIELKTDEGVLSEIQKFNLQKIGSCGGIAMVVFPANFIESMTFLESIARDMGKSLVTNDVVGLL